jgi:tetratricopeptide (TPR) repeat protein
MADQTGNKNLAIGLGLLNLTGLGLGYLYQKQWKRWGIHFALTILLVAVAILTNASRLPFLWLPLFGLWLCWMGFDGWRLGQKHSPEQSLFPLNLPDKLGWLVFAVPAVLVILVGAGLVGYYFLGQSEYNRGIRAHRVADCQSAVKHFRRVSSLYELTFNPWIAVADELLAECEVLLAGDQAYQDGLYEEAIQHYQDYLMIDSDTLLFSYTDGALAASYFGWAADLMAGEDYQEAIENYLIILEEYPDTETADEVPGPLAESYLMLSAQLWESRDWEDAIAAALVPKEDYPDTSAGERAPEQIAEIYIDWAEGLKEDKQYSQAVDNINRVLDEYPDTQAAENLSDLSAELYYGWAGYLQETNAFEESIEKYEILLKDFPQAYNAAEINNEIKSAYMAWGKQSREISLFRRAVEIYKRFQDDYPQESRSENIPDLILQTQLEWADDLLQDKKFTQAMDKYTEIKDLTEDPEIIATAEEGYQSALWDLSQDQGSDGQDIIDAAFKTACAGEAAASPAVGLEEDQPAKARSCSSDLKLDQALMPKYPGQFQYVVSKTEGNETIQSCPYQQGHTLIRQKQYYLITVRRTTTGNIYTTKKFYGSEPEKCLRTEWFSSSTKYKYGTKPSLSEVIIWLEGLFR